MINAASQRTLGVCVGLLIATFTLSACTQTAQPTVETTRDVGVNSAPAAADKQGETTKTGVLTQTGDKFFLTEAGQEPKEVNSYAVDLTEFAGQTVTVTGQYSGDTLYIGSVQMAQ